MRTRCRVFMLHAVLVFQVISYTRVAPLKHVSRPLRCLFLRLPRSHFTRIDNSSAEHCRYCALCTNNVLNGRSASKTSVEHFARAHAAHVQISPATKKVSRKTKWVKAIELVANLKIIFLEYFSGAALWRYSR